MKFNLKTTPEESIKQEDIPGEVLSVWAIQMADQPIGLDIYQAIHQVIDKYPKYFPWEHKYKSIPQEVHDTYHKDKDLNWGKSFEEYFKDAHNNDDGSFKGLIPLIQERLNKATPETASYPQPVTAKSLTQMLMDMGKAEDERRQRQIEQQKKDKALWDKHYKKYGLEYRP